MYNFNRLKFKAHLLSRANDIMLSLDPHDKFGNKHQQASLPAVSDL